MSFTVVIPARYASQRLPGKPLLDIAGKPMIERVYVAAQKSEAERVVVATDDQRIAGTVKAFGGEVFLTSESHESGTDRLQEVVQKMDLPAEASVVNVQGDEPLIPAEVINQVAQNLQRNAQASAATLCVPLVDRASLTDPNNVKVVMDNSGMALYFSRAAIPWARDSYQTAMFCEEQMGEAPVVLAHRHIGLYAYRASLLNHFVSWPIAELETIEKLEQLRILANGHKIHVAQACVPVPGGVDTQEDLERVTAIIRRESQ